MTRQQENQRKGAVGAKAAADIESAARLIKQAARLLDDLPTEYIARVERITGAESISIFMARDLQSLSDHIQAAVDVLLEDQQ